MSSLAGGYFGTWHHRSLCCSSTNHLKIIQTDTRFISERHPSETIIHRKNQEQDEWSLSLVDLQGNIYSQMDKKSNDHFCLFVIFYIILLHHFGSNSSCLAKYIRFWCSTICCSFKPNSHAFIVSLSRWQPLKQVKKPTNILFFLLKKKLIHLHFEKKIFCKYFPSKNNIHRRLPLNSLR